MNDYIDYEKRIEQVLARMKSGETRDEIASSLGYANTRSLDALLRRRGYIVQNGKYVKKPSSMNSTDHLGLPLKAEKIANEISQYREAGLDLPSNFAIEHGFQSQMEMQQYLKSAGLKFDNKSKIYVPDVKNDAELKPEQTFRTEERKKSLDEMEQCADTSVSVDVKYKALLDFLYENREQLVKVCKPNVVDTRIPRISIAGPKKIKSIYMNAGLAVILDDCCEKNGITIRDVVEGALIDYLSAYNYQTEIEQLLNRN